MVGEHQSLETRFGAEVEKECDFDGSSPEAGDQSCFVSGLNGRAGLYVYQYDVVNEQVRAEQAHGTVLAADRDGHLALGLDTELSQLFGEYVYVHRLHAATPELLVDRVEGSEDFASQPSVQLSLHDSNLRALGNLEFHTARLHPNRSRRSIIPLLPGAISCSLRLPWGHRCDPSLSARHGRLPEVSAREPTRQI